MRQAKTFVLVACAIIGLSPLGGMSAAFAADKADKADKVVKPDAGELPESLPDLPTKATEGEPAAETSGASSEAPAAMGLDVPEDKELAAPENLDPARWAASVKDLHGIVKIPGSFPRKILVVGDLGTKGEPKMVEIDAAELKANTFVSLVPADQIRWAYLLNAGSGARSGATDKKDELTRVLVLFKLSGADLVVKCESGSSTCILFGSKDDSIRRVVTPGLDKPKDGVAVRQWLRKVFGYDAVVLARSGQYALVGGFEPFSGDRLQALALGGSEKRYIMSGQPRKGLAVLQLVRRSGPWGIFHVVLGDKRAEKEGVPVGTKLIVESSK